MTDQPGDVCDFGIHENLNFFVGFDYFYQIKKFF
jgi:hypothetical protein